MASAPASAAAVEQQQQQSAAPQHQPMEFSTKNMVKINTFDEFSPVQKVKRQIAKFIPPVPGAPEGSPEAISAALQGLARAGKNPSTPHLFLSFETPEARDRAMSLIIGTVQSRNQLWVQEEVSERDLEVKHKKGKRERQGTQVGDGVEQGPSVAPWMYLAYDEQLRRKADHCKGILKTVNKYSTVRDGRLRTGALLAGVVPSPMRVAYRNNVQLTCGVTTDGKPEVGFQVGQSVQGESAVMGPGDAPTVHPIALNVQRSFMDEIFKPFADRLPMYQKTVHRGFWRKLHIRNNKDAQVLLDIEVNPTGVSSEVLDEVRAALRAWGARYRSDVPPAEWCEEDLHDGVGEGGIPKGLSKVASAFASLQWHLYEGTSTAPSDTPRETLHGEPTLLQTLLGLNFDLSPEAFFQVNRRGCEQLLSRVADECQLKADRTTLLDLCCGTGTIGLCLSSRVKRTIGVEMVAGAIENAKVNAARNGVTNASFVCGKVEDVVFSVLKDLNPTSDDDVVAILDPPRCGVHSSVLKWLRNCAAIRRIVYISCDQRALERDCEPLVKPSSKQFSGLPFRVVGGFGVDLFPHTPHVEMVVTLQRLSLEDLNAVARGEHPDGPPRPLQQQQPAADAAAAANEGDQQKPEQPRAE